MTNDQNDTSEIRSEGQVEWNAVYTRHQHEKLAAESLVENGFEVFLPTYNVIRKWTDRKKQLSLPLFPCYVFVRSNFERRLRILTTPGVHFLVMFAGRPLRFLIWKWMRFVKQWRAGFGSNRIRSYNAATGSESRPDLLPMSRAFWFVRRVLID